MKAFISYSHKNEAIVDRLRDHMALQTRSGLIDIFYDRKILAGSEIDGAIANELSDSDLFLAIVSADFLASNYCHDIEMAKALERHEAGTIQVIPIIAEPCEWQKSPLGKLKAIPTDGKAISTWQNENNALLDVVNELRRVAENQQADVTGTSVQHESSRRRSASGSNRYRLRKTFDDVDKFQFREEAFNLICEYFEKAADEIAAIEGVRAIFRKLSPYSFTATVVNETFGRGVAHMTVHMGTDRSSLGDIFWSNNENAAPNGANGSWSISSSDYELGLQGTGFDIFSRTRGDELISPNVAAEQMWAGFIKSAGIEVA